MAKKKSWQEKLADDKGLPMVKKMEGKAVERWGKGTMLIPAPLEVDALMKKVRKGRLTTIEQLSLALAEKHEASICCPLTTGIFAWIASHAADEAEQEGKKRISPYWRTLKAGGELNPKYPGGIENLKARLTAEGHTVIQKGKRFLVQDFEKRVVKPKVE